MAVDADPVKAADVPPSYSTTTATSSSSPSSVVSPPLASKLRSSSPSSLSLTKPTTWLKLILALYLVYVLHLHLPTSFPTIEPIAYPALPGQDISYGLRVSIPTKRANGTTDRLLLEIGKIPDDDLKGRMLDTFVGVSDNWFFFKIQRGEDTHYLLATLFMANLVTRKEADQILSKGPTNSSSNFTSSVPSIHRIPSLLTLSATYYAGAEVGTRFLYRTFRLDPEDKFGPILVGVGTVLGSIVVFSKSSKGEERNVASMAREEIRLVGSGGLQGFAAFSESREKRFEVGMIRVLTDDERMNNPLFVAPPSFGTKSLIGGQVDREADDWLQVAMTRLRSPVPT